MLSESASHRSAASVAEAAAHPLAWEDAARRAAQVTLPLPLPPPLPLTLAQVGGALSTISAICGVGFYACVALSWLATLVLLGAHVHYGGALTARARSGGALLEATPR